MITWECVRCLHDLDGNPIACPHCGYTVYRPVTIQPVFKIVDGVEKVIGETRSAELPLGGTALADRRQRAREAFWDRYAPEQYDEQLPALTDAIETATRVKITQDIVDAGNGLPGRYAVIKAAFRAAGFEVEE